MGDPLIVFGSGGHAKVVIEAALASKPGREIIILDDSKSCRARSIFAIPVVGGRAELRSMGDVPIALGIGDNRDRADLMVWLARKGHILETVIHPSATVAPSVSLEPGVFVSAGAIVIAEARIGAGVIINTGATVDHDCVIDAAAHIAPGAHLCGNVRVGARTLVGVGASVRPSVRICEDAVIGAGSVVVRDLNEPGTFIGNPARRLT